MSPSNLKDGFYFFKDPSFPELWGMIERLNGRTWRIGEAMSMDDNDWDEAVTFYPAVPPDAIKRAMEHEATLTLRVADLEKRLLAIGREVRGAFVISKP